MKLLHLLLLKLSCIFLSVLLLQSCTDKPGTWKNEQIDAGKKAAFHELNTQSLAALKANDAKQLASVMSKDLKENSGINRQTELISNQLTDHHFVMLDEYYVVNQFPDFDTIKVNGQGIKRYGLTYPGYTKEMYMAFFVTEHSENKYMISLVYSKYDYGWKINELDLSPYTINGKTAPELFKLAKEEYSKKYLIDAVDNATLAVSCVRPNEIWNYPDDGDLRAFYGKLINEANVQYKFPFTINQVPTKPQIIRIYNETTEEGSFPKIYYLSKISVKDTAAIKKENALIRKAIGTVMPGINLENKFIFYSASNERPTDRKQVDHFEITDTLK